MQISLTTNVSKTTKNVQPDVTFIFTELFENVNSLVQIPQMIEMRNVGKLRKTSFFENVTSCACASM